MFALVLLAAWVEPSSSFATHERRHLSRHKSRLTRLKSTQDDNIDSFLSQYYPNFLSLITKNEKVRKALIGEDESTVFCPNDDAFFKLSEKEREQLNDPRNLETVEKIGAYHIIGEHVTADALFASGGVITLGGEVPVGRSVTGGFMGFGGQEDGGVTINGAKVTQSKQVGSVIVHEVDALISPKILWRYMDQLRIPGSS